MYPPGVSTTTSYWPPAASSDTEESLLSDELLDELLELEELEELDEELELEELEELDEDESSSPWLSSTYWCSGLQKENKINATTNELRTFDQTSLTLSRKQSLQTRPASELPTHAVDPSYGMHGAEAGDPKAQHKGPKFLTLRFQNESR